MWLVTAGISSGDLYAVLGGGVNNLSEDGRKAQRRAALDGIPAKDWIAFAPTQESAVVLYVFTDVDCPYCRRLHEDVARLGDHGVEVRYLAYPRSGPGTSAYDKMVSAWCSRDPGIAIAALFEGKDIDSVGCTSRPVAGRPPARRQPRTAVPKPWGARRRRAARRRARRCARGRRTPDGPCVDHQGVGESHRVVYDAFDHFLYEPPGPVRDPVVRKHVPELRKVGDPVRQRVQSAPYRPAPLARGGRAVPTRRRLRPTQFVPRPSCHEHVVDELRPEDQFRETAGVAQRLPNIVAKDRRRELPRKVDAVGQVGHSAQDRQQRVGVVSSDAVGQEPSFPGIELESDVAFQEIPGRRGMFLPHRFRRVVTFPSSSRSSRCRANADTRFPYSARLKSRRRMRQAPSPPQEISLGIRLSSRPAV